MPTAVAAPSGLVSWWRGNGNAFDSVGPNHGSITGNVTYAPGRVGSAFRFDGSSGIYADSIALPIGNSDRTMEMWAKADIFEGTFAGYDGYGLSTSQYTSGVGNLWGPGGLVGPKLQAGQWYHLAVTLSDNSETLFVNGQPKATESVSIATRKDSTFGIGGSFYGLVDEVSVYNRALTSAEIQSIYNAGADGKTANGDLRYFSAKASPSDVIEGATGSTTPAAITIYRSGNLSGPATVNWATSNGTATAGADYVAASGQVNFADGESQKSIEVSVLGDSITESNEAFDIVLSATSPNDVILGKATVTIVNDDADEPLDDTFGLAGVVIGPSVGPDYNYWYDGRTVRLKAQPDGKIVVGVPVRRPGQDLSYPSLFLLERFNSDGSLDMTFGTNGIVAMDYGNGGFDLCLQSDGKIIALAGGNISERNVIARYNSEGTLDSSFGLNGILALDLPGAPSRLLLDSSGDIIVAGSDSAAAFLARYDSNGQLDTSFGGGVVFAPQIDGQATGAGPLAISPSGKIILGASIASTAGIALYQFTSAGELDATFGTNGVVSGILPPGETTASVQGFLVKGNGEIIAAGTSSGAKQTLIGLTVTGDIDTAFGNQGFALNADAQGSGGGIVMDLNGDILVGGSAKNSADNDTLFVAAYLPNGSPDTTYGKNGVATARVTGGRVAPSAMSLQPDGKIVLAGWWLSNVHRPTLARFLPPNAKIGSFVANPNPVAMGTSVTLTASDILNSNPTSPIAQVRFYRDDGDNVLDPNLDTLLGNATQVSSGVWSLTSSSGFGLPSGTHTLFALATDSNGVLSDPIATQMTVVSAAPTVVSIAPFSGPTTGGATVIITGTNFVAGASVKFGGNAATDVVVNSSTQITAVSPPGTGAVDVTVQTAFGTGLLSNAYQYVQVGAPQFTGMVVNGGPMFAVDSLGNSPTSLVGKNSIITQLYVTFDIGVTLGAGAFTIDAAAVNNSASSGSTQPAAQNLNVVGIIAEPDVTTLDGNGGYKGYRLRFTSNALFGSSYYRTVDNSASLLGNISTVLIDGFYSLNVNGANVFAGSSVAGTPMTVNQQVAFWTLFGSNNPSSATLSPTLGDGNSFVSVSNLDLSDFSRAFTFNSAAAEYNAAFDYDLDGLIGNVDLSEFALRYANGWVF